MLCQRQFKSEEVLRKHINQSDLHKARSFLPPSSTLNRSGFKESLTFSLTSYILVIYHASYRNSPTTFALRITCCRFEMSPLSAHSPSVWKHPPCPSHHIPARILSPFVMDSRLTSSIPSWSPLANSGKLRLLTQSPMRPNLSTGTALPNDERRSTSPTSQAGPIFIRTRNADLPRGPKRDLHPPLRQRLVWSQARTRQMSGTSCWPRWAGRAGLVLGWRVQVESNR